MKKQKIKDNLTIAFIIFSFCWVIYGIGYLNYCVWRMEHPNAKTWTFFIPTRR